LNSYFSGNAFKKNDVQEMRLEKLPEKFILDVKHIFSLR